MVVTSGTGQKRVFPADEVFDSRLPENSQVAFFEKVAREPLAQSLRGINICILAYGYTGTGKTYTMLGDLAASTEDAVQRRRGLVPRFIAEIFAAHAKDPKRSELRYRCQYYEIYNEQIRDLLSSEQADLRRLAVHCHPKHGVWIDGLANSVVSSLDESLELLNFGNQMRTVASTTINSRSSRSHAIFSFWFDHGSQDGGHGHRESTVTFVDLAGREDQAANTNKHSQFREMCYINTSLFHLARLICKLSEGQVTKGSMVEYRNSKLTLLLSQAFSGNSQTMLVATLAPCSTYFDDTVSTLSFAQTMKKMRTQPVVNDKSSSKVVDELEAEVAELRRALGNMRAQDESKKRELAAAEAMISKFKQSWKEAKEESEVLRRARLELKSRMGMAGPNTLMKDDTSGAFVPFFTKLCDDPALQGCANYYLSAPTVRVGSDASACDIALAGIGMTACMCEVKRRPADGTVHVSLICDGGGTDAEEDWDEVDDDDVPRVLVNGTALKAGGAPVTMAHGDCVILGYSHAFRLIVPTEDRLRQCGERDATSMARNTVPCLDLETALAEAMDESNAQFKEAYPYLKQLQQRAPPSFVKEFLTSLHCVCPMIDEANALTKQVLGADVKIRFRLHLLTDVFDYDNDLSKLAVCVLLRRQPGLTPVNSRAGTSRDRRLTSLVPGGRNTLVNSIGLEYHMTLGALDHLLYVWSLEKFLMRLDVMRDVYETGLEAQDGFSSMRTWLRMKPYTNPWREMAFASTKLALTEPSCAGRECLEHDSTQNSDAQHSDAPGSPGFSLDRSERGGAAERKKRLTLSFVSPRATNSATSQPETSLNSPLSMSTQVDSQVSLVAVGEACAAFPRPWAASTEDSPAMGTRGQVATAMEKVTASRQVESQVSLVAVGEACAAFPRPWAASTEDSPAMDTRGQVATAMEKVTASRQVPRISLPRAVNSPVLEHRPLHPGSNVRAGACSSTSAISEDSGIQELTASGNQRFRCVSSLSLRTQSDTRSASLDSLACDIQTPLPTLLAPPRAGHSSVAFSGVVPRGAASSSPKRSISLEEAQATCRTHMVKSVASRARAMSPRQFCELVAKGSSGHPSVGQPPPANTIFLGLAKAYREQALRGAPCVSPRLSSSSSVAHGISTLQSLTTTANSVAAPAQVPSAQPGVDRGLRSVGTSVSPRQAILSGSRAASMAAATADPDWRPAVHARWVSTVRSMSPSPPTVAVPSRSSSQPPDSVRYRAASAGHNLSLSASAQRLPAVSRWPKTMPDCSPRSLPANSGEILHGRVDRLQRNVEMVVPAEDELSLQELYRESERLRQDVECHRQRIQAAAAALSCNGACTDMLPERVVVANQATGLLSGYTPPHPGRVFPLSSWHETVHSCRGASVHGGTSMMQVGGQTYVGAEPVAQNSACQPVVASGVPGPAVRVRPASTLERRSVVRYSSGATMDRPTAPGQQVAKASSRI